MTGFIASAFLSRNRVSLKEAFEGLELCEGKLSCTVLRGLDGSNPVRLLDHPGAISVVCGVSGRSWFELSDIANARCSSLSPTCEVRRELPAPLSRTKPGREGSVWQSVDSIQLE